MALSALIALGLPIILAVICCKKYRACFVPLLSGAVCFALFVMVFEHSLHLFVFGRFALPQKPLLYILYASFMAGLFEESARFLAFTFLKKKYRGIGTALAYGIGHGGIESVVLVGLSLLNTLILSVSVNAGKMEAISARLPEALVEQVKVQVQTVLATPAPLFLVGGIERVFALSAQIALSVLVFYAVHGKNSLWLYLAALLIHALLDVPAAAMQVGVMKNILIVEALVGIGAGAAVLGACSLHARAKRSEGEAG
jgi:uncharacterized membrane protein YhfC